ncbi:uncharacterized protein LOC132178068 [Corylus avellana]|uniref:uncharacterized protein LOC132178068 n=1 Tax=Corylus avellana TaxID=13451 RepID=UPI00286CFEC0|nr:uncharacterized protein LOC132178068 [Corylus avellana]
MQSTSQVIQPNNQVIQELRQSMQELKDANTQATGVAKWIGQSENEHSSKHQLYPMTQYWDNESIVDNNEEKELRSRLMAERHYMIDEDDARKSYHEHVQATTILESEEIDSWHPSGILIDVFGHRVVYDAHSSLEAKLSSVILNGDWFWRRARSEALVEIQARLHEIRFGPYDKPVWTVSRGGSYVSSETWDFLREKKVEVSWWKMVWFPNAIPKHAFILWLAVQDRLLTGDRLMKWGYKGEVKCFFCHNQIESRDHLFFECSFSYRIWKFCMHRCHENNSPIIWDEVLKLGISKWGTKTLKGLLCHLVLGSVIYNLWCTRNELKHSGHPISEEQILRKVLWEVRTRIAGKGKFSENRENLVLAAQWNLPADLFL